MEWRAEKRLTEHGDSVTVKDDIMKESEVRMMIAVRMTIVTEYSMKTSVSYF